MDTQPDRRALLKNALTAIDTLQAKLNAVEQAKKEPIAIVGMGCRFPGGANSPEAYWQLLQDRVDTIRLSPADRWDQEIAGDTAVSWYGSFLDGIDQFDPQFFGITPREAATMDPQQRLVLEVTWEALERAGIAPDSLRGSQTGIFVGITTNDYGHISLMGDPAELDVYTATGSALNVNPGRVAYTLGLHGPSLAIDTACSSSLVAVHLACASLRSGETDMALAGGVNALLKPEAFISFSRWGMMAPDGRCKTFDARADGFVRGEGCGMIVLKRLSDAQADGDNILAVIRGSAVNQDGRSSGLTVPNGLAQRAVISQALTNAGVKPADIGYVEAHGTGTTLGDPIEVEAIGNALRAGRTAVSSPLFLSSVKTNIGHLESASGIAGLMKVVLALQHQAIPGQLHLQERSPQIPWPAFPIEIPTQTTPWPAPDGPRLAGVSSFGFSGTNAHVVLAEAPAQSSMEPAAPRPFRLLTLSARSDTALKALAARFADHLADLPETAVADVAYTANTGRAQFNHRLAVIGPTLAAQREQMAAFAAGREANGVIVGAPVHARPRIAFLFTGQGAQYVQMGRQLFETEPVFRQVMEECAAVLRPYLPQPLLDVIYPAPDAAPETAVLIDQTQYTQPALFAIEYALARLWQSWGIEPVAVMGHSVGEFVAACVAGVFSLEDGLKLISARGRLMGGLPSGGAMAAVFADEVTVQQAIAAYHDQVSIAAINGPTNVVISGAGTAVSAILEQLAAQGIKGRPLTVSHAFHSPLMEPILDEFAAVAASVAFAEPQITLVSNVSGEAAGPEVQTAVYWRSHVRAPVRFADAMHSLHAEGVDLFLECGPQPTLSGMGQRCLPDGAATFVPSLRPGVADAEQIVRGLGQLYAAGASVNWAACQPGGRRIPLPTYPFQRQRYWVDLPKARRTQPKNALHPLLHEPIPSPLLADTVYASRLATDTPAYLDDHRVFGVPLFPGTGYLEVALAAAQLALGVDGITLADVQIQEAMVVPEEGERLVQTAVSPAQDNQATVRIFSQDETGSWQQHVTAVAEIISPPQPAAEPLAAVRARCPESVSGADYYQKLAEVGLDYGPAFRGIQTIQRRDGEALAEVALPPDTANRGYTLHPALLDACFQVIGAALPGFADGATANVYVPVGVTRFHVWQAGASRVTCHTVLEAGSGEAEALRGRMQLWDEAGQPVALIEGIQLQRVSRMALQKAAKRPFADLLYRVAWEPAALPDPIAPLDGHWLILADCDGFGAALADKLQQQGATTTLVAPEGFAVLDRPAYEGLIADATEQGERTLRGVVHLWGLLPQTDVAAAQQWGYGSALLLTQALLRQDGPQPHLWLATRGAQALSDETATAVDPSQTALWGFARTLAAEEPALQPVVIDLDPAAEAESGATAVLAELLAADGEDQVAWREGTRYAARLQRYQPDAGALPIPANEPFELFTTQQGILDNISVRRRATAVPGADEITLQIMASGLNFRDVLNALGMYPGPAGALGNECVGVVTAVGADVAQLQVGDTVMALADGTFASHVTARAAFVTPIPEGFSPEEAATIPITFLTAYYGLHHLAKIQPGDRVLIHAAAGGVGMAAVQLARQAGAEIFGTAGSPEKRALLSAQGVQHVMNSRTLDFADEIMDITHGEGVDIVLNSLADDFIGKSFAVLGENGRFLEIGKRGIWTPAQVAAFNPTLAYYAYDLADVARDEPHLIGEMFAALKAQFEAGGLRPLPLRTFPISRAVDAFRFMSQAKHVGKLVLTQQEVPLVRTDGAYLVTGGLGGLGLAVAAGLVERGARHLLLAGRSAPGAAAQAQIDQMRKAGANVVVAQADIAQAEEVQRLLERAAEMPPLRGVVHAAGVLADGRLRNQSWPQYEAVMAAKVLGSEHLHRLTQDLPLDFFVCFSAGAALLGSPGQVNYSAANAYMDGLAQARKAAGLPALSINWGAWADVGMAAGVDARTRAQWQASGIELIPPQEGVALMFQLLPQPAAQVAVLPMNWARLGQQGGERPFLRKLLTVSASATAGGREETILDQLAEAPASERLDLLQAYVQRQVAQVLGLSQMPDPQQGLTDIGMDSLMAVELSNRLRAGIGQPLPTTLAFEYPTIRVLTRYLAEEVLDLGMAETAVPENKSDVVTEAILDEIDGLSESEIEDSLLKELEDAGY
ncbi:MAG: type I polyketide synthase [Ardenticatenaceae bacterium]|nr:type I polyketide synthase [Ardenticatenaceae bacterium]